MSWVAVGLAFALGSLLGGQVFARIFALDLRGTGSGNIGATNALRAGGTRAALCVLLFDAGKGIAAALLLPQLAPGVAWLPWACGAAAVAGHVYSPLAGFSGGKGAATLIGVYLALLPLGVALALPVFALTLVLSGFVSLSVLLGGLTILIYVTLQPELGLMSEACVFAALMWAFLILTHRENVGRLIAGTERRFERVMLWKKDA